LSVRHLLADEWNASLVNQLILLALDLLDVVFHRVVPVRSWLCVAFMLNFNDFAEKSDAVDLKGLVKYRWIGI